VRFFAGDHTHESAEVLHALVDDPDRFFDMALVAYNFKSGDEVKEAITRAAGQKSAYCHEDTGRRIRKGSPGPISAHQAALKWVLQDRNVTAAIPGMRNMAELREDIAVMGMQFGYLDGLILKRYGAPYGTNTAISALNASRHAPKM